MKYRRLTWDQACRFAAERRRLWACAYDIDSQLLPLKEVGACCSPAVQTV